MPTIFSGLTPQGGKKRKGCWGPGFSRLSKPRSATPTSGYKTPFMRYAINSFPCHFARKCISVNVIEYWERFAGFVSQRFECHPSIHGKPCSRGSRPSPAAGWESNTIRTIGRVLRDHACRVQDEENLQRSELGTGTNAGRNKSGCGRNGVRQGRFAVSRLPAAENPHRIMFREFCPGYRSLPADANPPRKRRLCGRAPTRTRS